MLFRVIICQYKSYFWNCNKFNLTLTIVFFIKIQAHLDLFVRKLPHMWMSFNKFYYEMFADSLKSIMDEISIFQNGYRNLSSRTVLYLTSLPTFFILIRFLSLQQSNNLWMSIFNFIVIINQPRTTVFTSVYQKLSVLTRYWVYKYWFH